MKTISLAAALAALGLPLAAAAQSGDRGEAWNRLSYTYGDARLVIQEPDGGGSFEGIRLDGAVQFQPQLFATGALTTVSDNGADIDTLDLGLGIRQATRGSVDLVGIVGIVWGEIDAGPFSEDDTGLSLTGGVRAMLAPRFEAGGYVSYVDLFGDGDVSLIGEALLHLTPQAALVGSVSLSDDVNTLTFGGRWNFAAAR